MAVFRVERNKGYTVMSNHHLRNKELSLKAKGLLSQMLSLPEDWDYTLKGLSLINREKIDAIREAIKELERAGYIVRSRERDEKGRLRGADYVIFEQPQPPTPDLPTLENPTLDNPMQEKPTLEKPTLENPTQLNKDIQRTDLPKKEKIITDEQSTHSIPILSPNPSPCREAAAPPERKGTEAAAQSAVDIYREIIKDNIDYHILKQDMKFDSDRLDEIVDLMLATNVFIPYALLRSYARFCQTSAKEKRCNPQKKITTLSKPYSILTDTSYLPSVSTSAISFAVALTIRMPVSLIPSRSASSCRRCVFFSGGVSKRNWSTDIL